MTKALYPTLCSTVLRGVHCRDITGGHYLVVDYSVECAGRDYEFHRMMALLYFVLFVVGIPVAVSFLLGAFLIAPVGGYVLTYVARCCGEVRLYGLWLGLIAGYLIWDIPMSSDIVTVSIVSTVLVILGICLLCYRQALRERSARDAKATADEGADEEKEDANANEETPLLQEKKEP